MSQSVFTADRGLSFRIAGKYRDEKTGRYVSGLAIGGLSGGVRNSDGSPSRIRTQITTRGLNRFIGILRAIPDEYTIELRKAYIRIAKKVLNRADFYVPTATGKLRGTGKIGGQSIIDSNNRLGIKLPQMGDNDLNQVISIQYGGHSAPYAVYVHEDETKRHGAAYLAHQAMLQSQKMAKQTKEYGRVHPRSVAKFQGILKNAKEGENAQAHRPQEQYKWMEQAWQDTYQYADAQIASSVRSIYNRLEKVKDNPVTGVYLKGLRTKRGTKRRTFSSREGGQE